MWNKKHICPKCGEKKYKNDKYLGLYVCSSCGFMGMGRSLVPFLDDKISDDPDMILDVIDDFTNKSHCHRCNATFNNPLPIEKKEFEFQDIYLFQCPKCKSRGFVCVGFEIVDGVRMIKDQVLEMVVDSRYLRIKNLFKKILNKLKAL